MKDGSGSGTRNRKAGNWGLSEAKGFAIIKNRFYVLSMLW